MLSIWSASTVVQSARNGSLDEERRAKFLTEVGDDFAHSPLGNSHIKRTGALLSCLVSAKPITKLFRFQKTGRENVEVFPDQPAPSVELTKEIRLLELAPNEYLSFVYCWDLFFSIEGQREDKKALIDPKRPPMTGHYLVNMLSILQSGDFSPLSLYMIFKSYDLFSVDQLDEYGWDTVA